MLELHPPTTREARREVTPGSQRREPGRMLVGFDGSAESLAAIRWAAQRTDALIVATALPADDRRFPGWLADEWLVTPNEEPALASCAWLPVTAEGATMAQALVESAREHACEQIVLGADGDGDGILQELLRIADVPVVVVPTEDRRS